MGKGLVIRSTGSWYSVETIGGKIFECKIKGKLRLSGIKATNPISVGDIVNFEIETDQNQGLITGISQRRNYIIRKASNLSKQYQIIAANIDLAVLLVTIRDPVTYTEFIDRFLITAEAYEIQAAIIFNKTDIYSHKDMSLMNKLSDIYSSIGYHTLNISVKESINIDKVYNLFEGKKTLLSGKSGSGKSSLINKLKPGISLKTNSISSYHKTGQHTTTFPEMFKINDGTYLIDTPGIKSFGIIDFYDAELYHYFPEIFNVSHQCRFNNCLHINEPDCAVIKSVENNIISKTRYLNYIKIMKDNNKKYRSF